MTSMTTPTNLKAGEPMEQYRNEFRIGNVLSCKNMGNNYHPFKIESGLDIDDIINNPDRYKAISISAENLVKMGFSNTTNGIQIPVLDGYVFINRLFGGVMTLEIDGNRMPLMGVQYLHQLQNLYWCLCGEELEVKL